MTDEDTKNHILNILRRGTVTWSGRSLALKRARKKVNDGTFTKDGAPKFKLYWQCAQCLSWFKNPNELEVDHIVEVGTFSGSFDDFIKRLYCGQENLQVLCLKCHSKKTSGFNATLRYNRKTKT